MKEKLKNRFYSPFVFWHHKDQTKKQETSSSKARDAREYDYLHNGGLALDIATTSDLKKTLPSFLTPVQQQLNLCFSEETECQIHLVLMPTANTSKPDIIQASNTNTSSIILNQLTVQFSRLPPSNHSANQIALNACSNEIHSELLTPENTFPCAWLVLVFNDRMPLATTIQHHISPISHALSRGLCAAFEREHQIQQAITAERSSQAAELHDSMAQILGYLRLKTSQMSTLCQQQNNTELQNLAADITHQTHYAYRTTRELISTSRLSTQDKKLSQIIRETITEFEQQSNVVFELDNRALQGDHSGEEETQLQFIVREALSNIVRHSHATHARVQLNSDDHYLTIKIEDNGHGIKQENKSHDSFGLTIMKERADKIGAEFRINNRQPHGTVIEISHRYTQ